MVKNKIENIWACDTCSSLFYVSAVILYGALTYFLFICPSFFYSFQPSFLFASSNLFLVHIYFVSRCVIRHVCSYQFKFDGNNFSSESFLFNSKSADIISSDFDPWVRLKNKYSFCLERCNIHLKNETSRSDFYSKIIKCDIAHPANTQTTLGIDAFWDKPTLKITLRRAKWNVQYKLALLPTENIILDTLLNPKPAAPSQHTDYSRNRCFLGQTYTRNNSSTGKVERTIQISLASHGEYHLGYTC